MHIIDKYIVMQISFVNMHAYGIHLYHNADADMDLDTDADKSTLVIYRCVSDLNGPLT